MVHVIIAALVFAFSLVAWNLVHLAPRSVSMLLPEKLCLIVGLVLLPLGVFSAFTAAYAQQDPVGTIGSIAMAYVGLWFLLVKPAGDGSFQVEFMIKRLFLMMGLLMAVLVGTLYLGDSKFVPVFNLMLMAGGFWVTINYLEFLDRGR
jgi:hypothetical protein